MKMFERLSLITYLSISFAIGIFLLNISNGFVLFLVVILLFFALFIFFRQPLIVLTVCVFLLLGLFVGFLQNSPKVNTSIKQYYGKNVEVEGLVVSDAIKKNRLYGFNLKVDEINNQKVNILIQAYTSSKGVRLGNYIRTRGNLKPPFRTNSSLKAAIFSYSGITHTKNNQFWLAIGNIRSWVKKSLQTKKGDARAFLAAMITGQTNDLSATAKADLRASGLAHLWAVSGLHTGFVVVLILFLFRLLGLKSGWQLLFLIISLFLFSAFTGFNPPVIRASIMAIWLAGAYLLGRKRSWITALSSAALITLAIDPSSLFTLSFQLSYSAIISLFLFKDKIALLIEGLPSKLNDLLSVGISVQILIVPLLAFYFKEIQVFAVIANMLVIPLAALTYYLTIFALLAKTIGLNLLLLPSLLATYILKVGAFINSMPLSSFAVSPLFFVLLVTVFAAVMIFILLGRHKTVKKFYSITFSSIVILILAVIAFQLWLPAANEAISGKNTTVEFFDVGQGDAALITGPNKEKILIDSGPKAYVIQKHLLKRKVKSLDMVIASHADADHIGGLSRVLREFKVKTVLDNGYPQSSYFYTDFLKTVRLKKIHLIRAKRGDQLLVGVLRLDILNPPEEFFRGSKADGNNNSIVFRLKYFSTSFLFTGDIEFDIEKDLIDTKALESTVLKVPHHGSAGSTSLEFLKAVKPKIALVSVGINNPYGHPKPQLLKRLAMAHAKIYRTDKSSDVKMVATKKSLIIYD